MNLGIVVIIIIVVLLIWGICISNKFNRLNIKIDEAESGIDVALAKRYDVLTKMVDTVKGYAKHEKGTLLEVVAFRKGMTIEEKNEAYAKMDETLSKINVLVENYPDLKASQNFLQLQAAIMDVEEHLQAARRLYNANVSELNQSIVVFPGSVIAKMKGTVKREFFKAESFKKEDVKIDL